MAHRTALVVGGARGIGAVVARALAAAGLRVAVTSRDVDVATSFAASLPPVSPPDVPPHFGAACDVSDSDSVNSLFDAVVTDVFDGQLDAMVYCAGASMDKLAIRTRPEDAAHVVGVNLLGAMQCGGLAARAMLRGRTAGSIVTLGSAVATAGSAGQSAYCASKSGLVGYTRSLAKEVGSRGVRVNLVEPGFVATDMTAHLSDDRVKDVLHHTPLKRLGTAEDVAAMVAFLTQPGSEFVTGGVFAVDGGLVVP